jgi:ribosome-associated protein
MKSQNPPALELVRMCCRVLDDKKAGNLAVLDVSAQSSITDYLVIATATSDPHLRALRNELEKALDAGNVRIVGIERAQESGWMVIDAFDVMIHLFLGDVRERYGLERLWRDATEVAVGDLLQLPKAKAPAKKKARATAPKGKAKAAAKAKPKAKAKSKRA